MTLACQYHTAEPTIQKFICQKNPLSLFSLKWRINISR
jgi:hypothetical protein